MRVVTLKSVKHGGKFHPPGTELDIEDPAVAERLVKGGAAHHAGHGHRMTAPVAGDDPAASAKLQTAQADLRAARGEIKRLEGELTKARQQAADLGAEVKRATTAADHAEIENTELRELVAALKAAAEKGAGDAQP